MHRLVELREVSSCLPSGAGVSSVTEDMKRENLPS